MMPVVYQIAGVLGMDPGPFTLRELFWMVRGARIDAWNHTASLLAAVCSGFSSFTKRPQKFAPAQFHPFAGDARESRRFTVGALMKWKSFFKRKRRER